MTLTVESILMNCINGMSNMNFLLILTDTQNLSMVGTYGNHHARTPNLDRLASQGICFHRAYTASPLCTPARSAIFSGLHPQINGAFIFSR